MKVEGARNFDAPREVVWEVLNDPSRMAKTMPGVESFDIRDERHWTANVKVPLGIGGLKLSIDFEKTEEREPEYAELQAKGKGVGAMLNMRTRFTLAEEGATTAMLWEADVRIGGTVGSMGQRVVQPIVNQQVASVLDALDEQVMQAKGQRSPQAAATGGGAASAPDVYLGAVPSDKDLFAEDADTGAGDTGDSVARSTGTVAVPPPSTEAPATTEPEVYIGAEPGVRPPAPVEWTPDEGSGESPEGAAPGASVPSRPNVEHPGPSAESSPEADAAESEGSSGADEGLNPLSPEAYDPEPTGPTTSTEDPS